MSNSSDIFNLFSSVIKLTSDKSKVIEPYDPSESIISKIGKKIDEKVQQEINKELVRERLDILEHTNDTENIKRFYTPNEAEEARLVSLIKKNDPEFDKELFEHYAEDIFRKFQQAYCNNDFDALRKYVDVNVIELFKMQASNNNLDVGKEEIIIDGVNYVDFYDYQREGELEIIRVAIGVNFYDFVKDSNGEIIKGSDKIKNRSVYFMAFAREFGAKTINNIKDYKDGNAICPNCGAKIVNSYSECEFCHTILYNGTENWRLVHIEEI